MTKPFIEPEAKKMYEEKRTQGRNACQCAW